MSRFTFFLIAFLAGIASSKVPINGRIKRTTNNNPQYITWPEKNILYYLDSSYTLAEKVAIRSAVQKVALGTRQCITFTEVNAADTRYKVKVTPDDLFIASGGEPYCFSYPGKINPTIYRGRDQNLVLTRGTYGCMDRRLPQDIMKYFVVLLGRRNEHQRGDRDTYITVDEDNLVFPLAYKKYTASDAKWGRYPYDFCSITHNGPTEYAHPNVKAFVVNNDPQAIPNVAALSNTDCRIISELYGCDPSLCVATNCAALQRAALPPTTRAPATTTTTARPTTTTAAPTTTTAAPTTTTAAPTTTPPTCSKDTFCAKSPDESVHLLGPFSNSQTYLIFSSTCLMEYAMDFASTSLQSLLGPKLIKEYLPPPGGPTDVPPITLAFTTVETDAAGDSVMMMNMQNQAGSSSLRCQTDPSARSNPPSCPAPAVSTGIIPTATATAASSQISLGDGLMYNLVVDAAGTNVKLMDTTFTTTYQTTANFLTGQATITKITAIQIVTDEDGGPIENALVVFGTGADNVTPFVGFVVMPLTALPSLALTPVAWIGEPQPLKTVLAGC